MKNIFYITYSSIPSMLPSSLQIIKTCESLSRNNNRVTLIKPGTGNKNFSIKKYYDLKERVHIKEFQSIKIFPQGIKFYLYSMYCLFYILKKKEPIIITRNYFIGYLLTLFKKKVILEIHHDTTGESRIARFILRYFNFLNKKNLLNIVAVTKSVKELFINKYKVKSDKIIVLPSGSSIKIKLKPKFNYNKRLKVGYFGSISPSKGIYTLIKLSKIDKENDYYIYGGSKEQINKLRKKNFNRNLFLKESVPYSSLTKILLEMDILTLPYTKTVKSAGEVDDISKYTSPLKLFDYLAVGKTIVCSNLKVLREVINHKNAYFVHNFENVFEWKKKVEIAKKNKNKDYIISRNNFELSKKYNHTKRVKEYI